MQWKCKYCFFSCEKRALLLKHYRIKHGSYARTTPFPCLHADCLCSFKSFNALKVHLTRSHSQHDGEQTSVSKESQLIFHCPLCEFKEPCTESEFFTHLRQHLKRNEKVQCPFNDCNFESRIYSTFNAHKCKEHQLSSQRKLKPSIAVEIQNLAAELPQDVAQNTSYHESMDSTEFGENEKDDQTQNLDHLQNQLERNLGLLFLKMQTILHISDSAVQEVIQQINQIFLLSKPLLCNAIQQILDQHGVSDNSSVLRDIVKAVTENNLILKMTDSGEPLSTVGKRASYFQKQFPIVVPTEYKLGKDSQSFAYVPILNMLQVLLNRTDVFEKVLAPFENANGINSYKDSTNYRENDFLVAGTFRILLTMYTDEFEIANPLGTSKKKHKMFGVYWVLANLPSKHRSSLQAIQLALLCKASEVKQYGYEKVLHPLVQDLKTLETYGVFLEQLGECVKGTVLNVSADNLGAHSLAGFQESFIVEHPCRFCMVKKSEIQQKDVLSGRFEPRTKVNHDRQVEEVLKDQNLVKQYGVKGRCVLNELDHFHSVSGFPPDIMHDLLEGVIPIEMALCLNDLINKKYITLEYVNRTIKQFPYKFIDKTDQPQVIPTTFASRGTIGGNGHENWALLRLLPLMIGFDIPENDATWEILMLLKDILELATSFRFTDDTIDFLGAKISEHRGLLLKVFPHFVLRPKHHYIEHYPQLIRTYGPLRDVWTMRFEGKHKFFKQIICETKNFKNVTQTLALRHQRMIAYHMDSSSFFKPSVQMDKVTCTLTSSFPESVQNVLQQNFVTQSTVLVTSKVCIDGINYSPDMVLSAGATSCLPDFRQIVKIVIINTEILFVCKQQTAWYIEHLRSYELCSHVSEITVTKLFELNDPFPLSPYKIQGRTFVTAKHYIFC